MIRLGKMISVLMLTAFVSLLWQGSIVLADTPENVPRGDDRSFEGDWPPSDYFLAQVEQTDPPVPKKEQMHKRRKHIEQLRLLKLLELLDLGPDQETQFIVEFRRFRKGMRDIHRTRVNIIDSLTGGLRTGDISPELIYQLTNRLETLYSKQRKQQQAFLQKARQTLEPNQFGRLIVFRERFEQALLEEVKAFHDRPGHRGGGGGW